MYTPSDGAYAIYIVMYLQSKEKYAASMCIRLCTYIYIYTNLIYDSVNSENLFQQSIFTVFLLYCKLVKYISSFKRRDSSAQHNSLEKTHKHLCSLLLFSHT